MAYPGNFDPVIRELWPQQRINNLMLDGAAVLALMPKDQTFAEKARHISLQYGNPQGRSHTFASAQAADTDPSYGEFVLKRIQDYGVGTLDGETLESTQDNKAALVNALDDKIKGAISELGLNMNRGLWSTGTGKKGAIKAGTTPGTTITLSDPDDSKNFDVGMTLVVATTETGAIRSSTDTPKITAVNRDAGTLEVDADTSLYTSAWAAGDYIFQVGDAANGGAVKGWSGIPAWVPITAPTSTAFFGLDRTADVTRLGGVRSDQSAAGSVTEALQLFLARIRREGNRANPELLAMHPEDVGNLCIENQGKVTYERMSAGDVPVRLANGRMTTQAATIGFDAIMVATLGLRVKVVDDYQVPKGYAWALKMSTWSLDTLKAAPRIIQHDGLRVARQSGADGVEFRAVARGNFECNAPGWNGVCTLPA